MTGDPVDSLALTYLIDSDLAAGQPYQFRVRAKKLMVGDYSEIVTAIPASPPGKPDAVTVEIDNIYVKISWHEPLTSGAAIDAYKVIIVAGDGLTWAEASSCDGTDQTVIDNRYCLAPMQQLTSVLVSDQIIKGRQQVQPR